MTTELTFFIVTPSYNQASFINQTIDSVLQQKGNFKLVYWVMDGGSTDGTIEILKKYQKKINWVSKPDGGQAVAINNALKKLFESPLNLDQTIFAYLNSDDYLLPDSLKQVSEIFTNPATQWLVGDAKIINEHDQQIQTSIRVYKKIWRNILGIFPASLLILNSIAQPATFIRGSMMKKIGYFNAKLHYTMDYEYWLRLIKKVGSPMVVNQMWAAFRIHKLSKGSQNFKKQFKEQLQVAKKINSNMLLLWLQKLHNQLIIFIYNLIK